MAYEVTLITGDGTGPELAEAARKCVDATGVEIRWDVQPAGIDIMETAGTASQLPIPAIVKTALALACWLMLALALVHLAQVLERLFGRRREPT